MKTLAYNNPVIASDSTTLGGKSPGNLHETTSGLNQGDRLPLPQAGFFDYPLHLNSNYESPRDDGWKAGFFSKIILVGLMTLLLSPLSFAQNFDANRMNRDIKIMENILEEMFKTQFTSNQGTVEVRSSSYTFFGGNSSGNVKGTYIPDYGVIFMIPSANKRYSVISRGGAERQVVFQYSSDDTDSDRAIDEESVTNRISEFLKDYASTIGQLKPNESILVIYGAGNSTNNNVAVFSIRGDRQDEAPEPLPVISVSAKKSDLEAYRAGSLNADTFKNRLSISTSQDKERLDLKVLGNIFRTALEEGDGSEFHLINSNSLSYMYLENFGALYSLNLHRGHGVHGLSSLTLVETPFFNNNPDRNTEESMEELKVKLEEQEKELSETLEEEYDAVVARTKEFIVDYGRTLSSLKDDQYLLVSLNISDSRGLVPDRVDFQIKKSVFNQLDRGQISREAALNAVTITEY